MQLKASPALQTFAESPSTARGGGWGRVVMWWYVMAWHGMSCYAMPQFCIFRPYTLTDPFAEFKVGTAPCDPKGLG